MRISFLASRSAKAQESLKYLLAHYESVEPVQAEVIVVLGGDGFMLRCIHEYMDHHIPLFGMNRGTIGFLMNRYDPTELISRIKTAELTRLHPLSMRAKTSSGQVEALAINEISLLRNSAQAAKIQIKVNGETKVDQLTADGVLVSTPAGSTAYNLSAHGPILPIGSKLLALTPLSPFRPRHWRGAILPNNVKIKLNILQAEKRPVNATADFREIRNVMELEINEDRNHTISLLFDPHHNLEERILNEQFAI
ncbi:MAG: NAD kinase [bacterium]